MTLTRKQFNSHLNKSKKGVHTLIIKDYNIGYCNRMCNIRSNFNKEHRSRINNYIVFVYKFCES